MNGSARRLAVVTGDHHQSDPTKHGAAYGPEDLACHQAMVEAIESLGRFDIRVFSDHRRLFEQLLEFAPELVVNF